MSTPRTASGIGVYLALVQFLFTLTWTVYVIFLPQLVVQAGLPKRAVLYILLLDQLVFVAADYAMGVAADRAGRVLGRIGRLVLMATLLSCLAFALLPTLAPQAGAWPLLLAIVVWAITSSALRAPPLTLLGKYAAQPTVPWLTSLSLFGIGLAGAVSPYLTVTLRELDPRVPFIVSSVVLALATFGILAAERRLASAGPVADTESASTPPAGRKPPVQPFLAAMLLAALGFQIHFSLNSAALFTRLANPGSLQYLMPVFWAGFNLCVLPASWAVKRHGGVIVAALGALAAAAAAWGAASASSLDALVISQFIAGAGWGCVLMSAVAAAIALGHTGREGRFVGGVFAILAVAAFLRIGVLTAELNQSPALAELLRWMPALAWGTSGALLLLIALRYRTASTAAA